MDDLNEVRQALGYEHINIMGGSYGTRAALVYIRQHGDTVRTATLNGVAPIPFTNPLYHAQGAQRALDLIFDEVEASPTYRKHLPGLREKFAELLKRFEDGPIEVEVNDDGNLKKVMLSRDAFANAVRIQMYYLGTSRKLPVLLWRAVNGDLQPFAESSIQSNRALAASLAMGMLLCVTAAEDIARIDPDSIEELTRGTFTGSSRVLQQMAACQDWPKSDLPEDFGEPVTSSVQTLILSGTLDPVTPPQWGELVAKNFPNSLHIVAPAAHGVGGPCIDKIRTQFLETGRVAGLDISCVKEMKLPPLYLPKEDFE
jgi:pimeloyl-ACP methyl ester carboxylesterase